MKISDVIKYDNVYKGYEIDIKPKYIEITTHGKKESHTFKLTDDVLKFIISQVEKEADRRDLGFGDYVKAIPDQFAGKVIKQIKDFYKEREKEKPTGK